MTDLTVEQVGADKITICHWTSDGGQWEAISVAHSALNGHDNHNFDVWPPVAGVTPGHNWENGSDVYLAGCVLGVNPTSGPTPSESATPSSGNSESPVPTLTATLPPTGPAELGFQVLGALVLVASGAWLRRVALRAGPNRKPRPEA